jgi:hypothetical protein
VNKKRIKNKLAYKDTRKEELKLARTRGFFKGSPSGDVWFGELRDT